MKVCFWFFVGATLACDTVDPPPPPITIELAQGELTVIPGQVGPGPFYSQTDNVSFTIHRNGYDGALTAHAAVESPSGAVLPITAGVELNPSDPTIGSLRIARPAGTSPGTYAVDVVATAGSLGSVSARLTVHVRPFATRTFVSSLVVNRGGGANTLTVRVTKDPNATVAVTTSTTPMGVLVTSTVSGNNIFLDVSAGLNATIGSYPLTITTSSGAFQDVREIQVVVQDPPLKRPVAFRLCRNQTAPAMQTYSYAYANDGEGWVAITPDADDKLRFDATERVAILERFMYPSMYAPGSAIRVMHLTATELETMQCPPARYGTKQFSVTTANATAYHVSVGALRRSSAGFPQGAAAAGPLDVIALGTRSVATGAEHRAIVRRGVDLPTGSPIALDFASAESVQLDSASLTTDAGATAVAYAQTATTVGRAGALATLSGRYWALPETVLLPGEVQSLLVTSATRGALQYFRAVAPISLAFGPGVATPVIDTAAQTITLASQTEYPDVAAVGQIEIRDFRGVYDYLEVWQSKAAVGGTPAAWTFRPVDFGRFASSRPWTMIAPGAFAGSGPAPLFFGGTPAPGTILKWGKLEGTAMGLPFPTGH